MNPFIVVVGSLNADFVFRVPRFPVPGETMVGRDFQLFPGGKGANQAFAAARLGGRVAMVGQVGNDTQAAWLRENLSGAGVDVRQVEADPGVSSGVASITINALGQNQIVIIPGANGSFTPARLESARALIAGATHVLLQLEIPLETVVEAARLGRQAGAVVLLDPAPAQELPEELLASVDYLTPNESELAILTHSPPASLTPAQAARLAKMLLARGVKNVIVKMGHQGAMLISASREHFWPALPVNPVDTTAAGDAFNGAFAVALAGGQSELAAGRFATAAAACSVTRAGAQPSMPTAAEVAELLTKHPVGEEADPAASGK